MVLTQHRGFRFAFAVDDGAGTLNPVRILVTAAALALHAAVFLLIIAPVAIPPSVSLEPEEQVIQLVEIKPKSVIPDKPPVAVPVATRTPTPTLTKPKPEVVATADPAPVLSPVGTETYEPVVVDAAPAANVDTAPAPPVFLEYVQAPPPTYPRAAQTGRREGQVMLRVTVGTDGLPTAVEIERSSGHRDLDAAARAQVLKHWRFRPAMKDGQAIPAIGMVPINFQLN